MSANRSQLPFTCLPSHGIDWYHKGMIEAETSWNETAYDCEHCGGIILKRIDRETGQPTQICHQCGQCGCQWSLSGELLRVGHGQHCQTAMQQYQTQEILERVPELPGKIPKEALIYGAIAILLFFFLARLGALAAVMRILLPVLAVAVVIWVIWHTLKQWS